MLVLPLVAALTSWLAGPRLAQAATVASGAVMLGLALALVPTVARIDPAGPLRKGAAAQVHPYGLHVVTALGGWLRVDSLSLVFLLATVFLYSLTAIFAVGYVSGPPGVDVTYRRRLFTGLNLFAWAMAMAPLVDNLGLLWVAIEVTTVVERVAGRHRRDRWCHRGGVEVHSSRFSRPRPIAPGHRRHVPRRQLLPWRRVRAVLRQADRRGRTVPGGDSQACLPARRRRLRHQGRLFPLHTWLPDAHSEAPTPVSALLSGALLATCFYAILRFYQITVPAAGAPFARDVLAVFGVATLLIGALYLASQRDLKRMLAYSSVEHMGILAIGMSFASPLAVAGVLLHVLAHAAAKGTAFFGAGSVVRKFHTKDLGRIRGGIGLLPWSGPLLVAAMLGLSALPPFGTFRSEFSIVAGGLSGTSGSLGQSVTAALVVLVTLAFLGLSWHITQIMASPAPGSNTTMARGETSKLMVLAMLVALAALVVLGVHPPSQLDNLFHGAVTELGV